MPTVIVTGASGGVGSVVVPHLLQQGWVVIAIVRSAESGKELEAQGALPRIADLTSADSTAEALRDLPNDTLGLVHLAGGIVSNNPLQETSAHDVEHLYMLNTFTFFNVARVVVPALQRTSGSIVSMGAQAVLHPVPNRSAYASSKAAVAALTLALAEEGRPFGLRANCLLPSIVRTEANLEWAEGNAADNWVKPEDIATTIAHLLDPSCTITGTLIPMYGKLPF